MTEFDFEELDKAVNGLMSNVDTKKRNPALDDPEDTVVELSPPDSTDKSTNGVSSSPETSELSPNDAVQAVAPAAVSAPALAVKRRGQFMDMIHPSSDMKVTTQRPSRQGITIAPAPAATDAPGLQEAPKVELPLTPKPEQPLAATAVAPESTLVDQESASEEIVGSVVDLPGSDPAPLVSPFLPDAKPEKRPLGSPLSPEPSTPEDPIAPKPVAPVETSAPGSSQPLPEELSGDVLSVESNDLTGHPEAAEAETTATPEQSTPTEAVAPVTQETSEVPATEVALEQPDTAPVTVPAGGSISQQYAESPSTGEQTSGSIYDTANYHKPITTSAAKKKASPLKWILLIIGLMVVGAAGGVAYFLLTQ